MTVKQEKNRVGIDLGGTKIELAAFNSKNQSIYRKRIPAPKNCYQSTLQALCGIVEEADALLGKSQQVGVGIPGCVSSRTGLVKGANSTWLIGKALDKDLSDALKRPVRIANDANCFALSEATALKEEANITANSVFGVILGTGVGGGLVLDTNLINGGNNIAGEWGHNPLPAPNEADLPAPDCYCGRSGCIETYLSGPALEKQYLEKTQTYASATEIALLADEGHPDALVIMTQYEDRLARALGSVINIFDPDVIILGGGLSRIERLYTHIPDIWSQYVFSDTVDTLLRPPYHGDSSGVRGAAWLWPKVN